MIHIVKVQSGSDPAPKKARPRRTFLASHKDPTRRYPVICKRRGCTHPLRKAQRGFCSDACALLFLDQLRAETKLVDEWFHTRWPMPTIAPSPEEFRELRLAVAKVRKRVEDLIPMESVRAYKAARRA
jgi:hypothetical protein